MGKYASTVRWIDVPRSEWTGLFYIIWWQLRQRPFYLHHTVPRCPDGSPRRGKLPYRTLDFSTFETRFLRILPYDFDETTPLLCCEVVYASVVSPPSYVALSYCWDDPSTTTPVIINGFKHHVTVNLEAALRQLRKRGKSLVWADAICINQGDLYERSYQVQRMGQIYHKALKVVSWLGNTPSPADNPVLSANLNSVICGVHAPLRYWLSLCQDPYWRRIWIIQEVSKARTVEIWHACHTYKLDNFIRDVLIKENDLALGYFDSLLLRSLQAFREREIQSHIAVPRMLLSEALLKSRHSLSTDQRDKLYALLSLTLDGNEVIPTPNYTQPAEDVFQEATTSMIVRQGQTALILLAGRCKPVRNSWIPNWLTLAAVLPPWITDSILHKRENLHFKTFVDADGLCLEGSLRDMVAWVPSHHAHSFDVQNPDAHHSQDCGDLRMHSYDDSLKVVLPIWDLITLFSKRKWSLPPYARWAFGKNCRTEHAAFALVALCLGTSKTPAPPSLASWYECHKDMPIYTISLQQWFRAHFRNTLKQCWSKEKFAHYREAPLKLIQEMANHELFMEAMIVQNGLRAIRLYGMKFVSTILNRVAVVHGSTQFNDMVFRLDNCPLPVVLRSRWPSTGFRYVGEVLRPTFEDGDGRSVENGYVTPVGNFDRLRRISHSSPHCVRSIRLI